MKNKSCLPQWNFYFPFLIFFILISQNQIAAAQSAAKAQKDFDKLNRAYRANSLSAKNYLYKAVELTNKYASDGTQFKTEELVNLLSLYHDLAWSKKEYSNARRDYYQAFVGNARTSGQTGAAMYYVDKITQMAKKEGAAYSLTEDDLKVSFFGEQELYHKIIAIYKQDEAFMKQLPERLKNKQVPDFEGMNAISILAEVTTSYIKTKDTVAVYQTTRLADQIGAALKRKYPINRQHMFGNDFYALIRKYSIAVFENNHAKAGLLLDSMQALKSIYTPGEIGFLDWNLFQLKIDHYLAIKNPDSARIYIKKFETIPLFLENQQAVIDEYKAKLQALQGDFHGGYTSINSALTGERKAKTSLMTQMDNLLYAYTEAENTRIDLQQSEAVKKQRTLWLVIISCSAALIILAIYLVMLYRSRKAKAQVTALNDAANMQIIAMEEIKLQAVKEEQQRLGQDLHDGLSSSIAAIRHRLESLAMDTEDSHLKMELDKLQAETANAYEAARRKSYEWFSAADEQQEQSFEKQIKLLTDNALPDSRYTKTIQIDDNSLANVGTDIRITLLRIIQEAVTNIIKHAKAKNVGILIYEEKDTLILAISDDGIGLSEDKLGNKKSSMGLGSIRRRVQYLDGETDIQSSNGTEITISIPLVLA